MTASRSRHFEVDHVGDITQVRFTDKRILDEQTVQTIRKQLLGLVDELGRRKLLLDFGSVEYLSSHVLGVLVTLNKRVNAARGRLSRSAEVLSQGAWFLVSSR